MRVLNFVRNKCLYEQMLRLEPTYTYDKELNTHIVIVLKIIMFNNNNIIYYSSIWYIYEYLELTRKYED